MEKTRTKNSQSQAVSGSSSSVSKQRSRKHGTSPASSDNHCGTCESKFILFSKKVRCEQCRTPYCKDCWNVGLQFCSVNIIQPERSKHTCKRCKILGGPAYSWNELVQLKTRELMQFLSAKHIDTSKCICKEDLAELILQTSGSDSFARAEIEHQQRVAIMVMRLQEDSTNSVPDNRGNAHGVTNSARPTGASVSAQQQATNFTGQDANGIHASEPSKHTSSASWRQRPQTERVLIEEIEEEAHLVELSSRQLKDILAYNFIDFRGVLERCELIELARKLWRSRNLQQTGGAASNGSTSETNSGVNAGAATGNQQSTQTATEAAKREIEDSELCKICMEREIDCVLLECGHLVTCTECGRVLADCPICRRYVARVVHIFKS